VARISQKYLKGVMGHKKTGKVYHPSLVASMKLASKKMGCYCSLMDSSPTYQITMVLHPGMKLEYFHNQNWNEWNDKAERLI